MKKILLSAKLRSARIKLGLTQTQVAFACGLHQSNYSHLETGNMRASPRTLGKIIQGYEKLGVDVSSFFSPLPLQPAKL